MLFGSSEIRKKIGVCHPHFSAPFWHLQSRKTRTSDGEQTENLTWFRRVETYEEIFDGNQNFSQIVIVFTTRSEPRGLLELGSGEDWTNKSQQEAYESNLVLWAQTFER